MDWSNERYVKLYVRNTAEWMAMAWQAKALLPLLLRACDRAGVIQVKPGAQRARLVAGLVGLPVDVVEPGLADLLVDGCIVESELGFTFRNYIEAQEAESSGALRNRELRARRRDRGMVEQRNVTERDETSRSETKRHATETPSLSEPSLAELKAIAGEAPAAADPEQPPPQKPAEPERSADPAFKLTSPPTQKPPPKPSEWEELRDRLDDARVRARPECPDDPGFCATRQEANALLSGAVKWLQEQQLAQDRQEAKALLRKAAWLYAADDWPGTQPGMTPWGLQVLLKRKHLAAYAAKAREVAWKHDELEDLWHPASWSP